MKLKLLRLIYSSFHGGVSAKAVDEILSKSRENNLRDRITGALVHGDDDFVQLLEGEPLLVTKCFMRIILDLRHQDIRIIYAEDSGDRLFKDWNMYAIMSSRVSRKVLVQSLTTGTFNPSDMSSAEGNDLFRNLLSKR